MLVRGPKGSSIRLWVISIQLPAKCFGNLSTSTLCYAVTSHLHTYYALLVTSKEVHSSLEVSGGLGA